MILELAIFVPEAVKLSFYAAFIAWTLGTRTRAVKTVHAEIRPFVMPLATLQAITPILLGGVHPWTVVFVVDLAISAVNYRMAKDLPGDDDDRWKRRRRKVAEKVAAVGGRLTVVPAGGAS